VAPTLYLRIPDVTGASWSADVRISFDGEQLGFSQDIGSIDALDVARVDIDLPVSLCWQPEQTEFVSSLNVEIVAVTSEGAEIYRDSAPMQFLSWDDSGDARLIPPDQLDTIAPAGVTDDLLYAELEALIDITGGHVQYGVVLPSDMTEDGGVE